MVVGKTSACAGCGLELPVEASAPVARLHASPECWRLYGEVTADTLSDPALGAFHQLTVDTYAAQHSGEGVAAITTAFALIGLHLALERGASSLEVRSAHKRLADRHRTWTRFPPPAPAVWTATILDVALAETASAREEAIRLWAREVWLAWHEHHAAVAVLASAVER